MGVCSVHCRDPRGEQSVGECDTDRLRKQKVSVLIADDEDYPDYLCHLRFQQAPLGHRDHLPDKRR